MFINLLIFKSKINYIFMERIMKKFFLLVLSVTIAIFVLGCNEDKSTTKSCCGVKAKKSCCANKTAKCAKCVKAAAAAKKSCCANKTVKCAKCIKAATAKKSCCANKTAKCAKCVKAATVKAATVKIGDWANETCPVMGGKVNKNMFGIYQGKKFYVCCPGCVATFLKNPDKYASKLLKK